MWQAEYGDGGGRVGRVRVLKVLSLEVGVESGREFDG